MNEYCFLFAVVNGSSNSAGGGKYLNLKRAFAGGNINAAVAIIIVCIRVLLLLVVVNIVIWVFIPSGHCQV